MNCDQRNDQIMFFAAGLAEPDEADDLCGHLATGCLVCAGRLAEARTMIAMLPLGLSRQEPPADMRKRMLAQLGKPAETLRSRPVVTAAPIWAQVAIPALIAACVAAGLSIFFAWRLGTWNGQIEALKTAVESQRLALNQMHIETASWAADKELRMVSLQATDQQPAAEARIFWDPSNHRWYFFATGLKDPPPGKCYELWVVCSNGSKIPIGGFEPAYNGDAAISTSIPSSITPIMAAVTDEPNESAITAPTGSFQLKGSVN